MSFIGKLHEISFYGLVSAIVCLICQKVTFPILFYAGFHVSNFIELFEAYLFWASVLFIPIAIIGAFATKYADHGEGLLFYSENIFVIILSHIAEEILGLLGTPFWFLKDLFTHSFTAWKVTDYILWLIEILFIALGFLFIFHIF